MAAKELNNTILKNSANLKAYYRFESGALTTDSSGNGITLTDVGGTTAGTGVFGNCADFSPGSKCLYKTGDIGMGTGAMTIVGWFKFNSHTTSQTFANFATSTYFTRFDWYQPSAIIRFYRAGTAQVGPTYSWTPTDGVWYHIAMVFNGTNTTGYINGAAVATNSGVVTNSTYTAGIGINSDGQNISSPVGSVNADDVAFYNTALSADQIKELYEGRTLGEGWPQSGLVGGWHLNGNSTDFSGNNNHGTDTAITYSLANGKFNQGAGFNGSSSKIVIGSTNIPTGNSARTIAMWIKPSVLPVDAGTEKSLIWYGTASNNQAFLIHLPLVNGVQKIRVGYYANDMDTTYTVSTTNWTYLCVTHNGTTTTLYVNGAPLNSFNPTAGVNTTIGTAPTFGVFSGNIYRYTGAMDEVQIYNVAKSADWVRKQYAWARGFYI